jgi:hypothetical protein
MGSVSFTRAPRWLLVLTYLVVVDDQRLTIMIDLRLIDLSLNYGRLRAALWACPNLAIIQGFVQWDSWIQG